MQKTFTLKSLIVLAALTVAAGAASAAEGKFCFEDGLKNSWTPPAPNISLGHDHGHGGHDGHHGGGKPSFDMDAHHGNTTGGISVSPVSEPATDAMLLTGLLMVGALVRRKSKSGGTSFASAVGA